MSHKLKAERDSQRIGKENWRIRAESAEQTARELLKFTSHGYSCAYWHAWNPRNKKCDCGLDELRKRLENGR